MGRRRARGGRSALLGLFEMITAIQAVGTGLRNLRGETEVTEQAVAIARKALRIHHPEVCIAELGAIALPAIEAGALTIEEAFVIDRIRFMIEVLAAIRDGMKIVRTGRGACRDAKIPSASRPCRGLLQRGSRPRRRRGDRDPRRLVGHFRRRRRRCCSRRCSCRSARSSRTRA